MSRKITISAGSLMIVASCATTALASTDPIIGTLEVLGKGVDNVPCAATRDKLKAAYDAVSAKDVDGIGEALQNGGTASQAG